MLVVVFFFKKRHSVSRQRILINFPSVFCNHRCSLRQHVRLAPLQQLNQTGRRRSGAGSTRHQRGCFSRTLTEPSSMPKYTTSAMSMNSPVSTTPEEREFTCWLTPEPPHCLNLLLSPCFCSLKGADASTTGLERSVQPG